MTGKVQHLGQAILVVAISVIAASSHAAISWDGGGSSSWWFDPANWSRENDPGGPFLPPSQGQPVTNTDTQINGIGAAPQATGANVVFDPAADPFRSAADSLQFDTANGFGPQTLRELYISRNTLNHNTLTINGDLTLTANAVIGRSGSTGTLLAQQNEGKVIQTGGSFKVNNNVMDLGNREASGWGNGVYDYQGGILEVGLVGGNGLRLSAGGSAGTGGVGRFIVHNPTTPGYIRANIFNVAANAGVAGSPAISANGVTNGVGIVEFNFENGGTRPIQLTSQLLINNGAVAAGTRSARLDLKLNSAPTVTDGKPLNLGLFDVDTLSDDFFIGFIGGDGDLGDFFSNANAANPLDPSALYSEGATVSASFGSTKYNWTISYTGNITWANQSASTVASITGAGTGVDVVLIGLSIESVGLPGDFDNNGLVDARDYTRWRDNLGGNSSVLNGNGTGAATVVQADYDLWKSKFGTGSGSGGLAVSAVPEPTSIVLVLATALGFAGIRRRNS